MQNGPPLISPITRFKIIHLVKTPDFWASILKTDAKYDPFESSVVSRAYLEKTISSGLNNSNDEAKGQKTRKPGKNCSI